MRIRLVDTPLAVPRYRQVRLPTVAAELAPFADVEINDENIEPIDYSPVDLVGFTAQAFNAPRAIFLSARFRKMGVKTIVGGPWPTTAPQAALEHFDAAVVGEVEGLGGRICDDLKKGALRGVYRSPAPPDLALARQPRRDLQKADRYYRANYPIEFSRGCPHRCSFCYGPFGFGTFRTRPLDAIAKDLEGWDYGYVEAVDMHFAANRLHAIEVCKLIEQTKIWSWTGEATLKSMDDPELLEHLARSRCRAVFVGMESIEEAALAASNKQFNKVEDYRRIIRMMQDHGILVHVGLMWGLDGATKECFDTTMRFCEENRIFLASTNLVSFFPGTPNHTKLADEGRIVTRDLRDYDSARVLVEPQGMTGQEVIDGARRFASRFYSYRSIFRRALQPACFNLSQFLGFWGFNITYRAYFKMWCKRLGATDTTWPAPEDEKETFPFVGGKMPLTYSLAQLEAQLLDVMQRAWLRAPKLTSLLPTLLVVGAAALASVAAFAGVEHLEQGLWPAAWPPTWAVLLAFLGATDLSALLVARVARTRASEPLLLMLALLCFVPMGCSVFALPEYANGWRALTAWSTVVLLMKAVDVVRGGEGQTSSSYRIFSFLVFFPTLQLRGSFQFDETKRLLSRHWPLMWAGAVRFWGGVFLSWGLIYLGLQGDLRGPWAVLDWIGAAISMVLINKGTLEYWTGYWRMAGYTVPVPAGPWPLAPRAPSRLWRALNFSMSRWLVQHVYRPLGGKIFPPGISMGRGSR